MVCWVNASFWYSITATCPKPEHSAPLDTLAHNTHPVKSPVRCDKTTTPNGPFATKVYLLYGFWVDGLLGALDVHTANSWVPGDLPPTV
jgi:hypothetical protein